MLKGGRESCGRGTAACTDGALEFERLGSVAFCIVSILCAIRSSGIYWRLKKTMVSNKAGGWCALWRMTSTLRINNLYDLTCTLP